MKVQTGRRRMLMNLVKFKIYKLHFTAPLHIGDKRDDASVSQKTIHSDTLHAALISCLAKVGKPVPEDGDLGCVISDLFPFYQEKENSEPTYFLPMPMQTTFPLLADPADAKKVKKVQWVDAKLYGKLLQGEKFFKGKKEELSLIQASYMTEKNLPMDAKGSKDFVKSEVMQRVKIEDRTGKTPAMPYYVDRISFKDYSGLFFLVLGDSTQLDEALQILEMEGIGTDRHVGYGFFKAVKEEKDFVIETPENAHHQVSLSMLIPESKEQLNDLLNDEIAAYDFTRCGGWITTPPYITLRKNAIYAFLPGSVFHRTTNDYGLGRIVNLKPNNEIGGRRVDHPIWRNGKSIVLPIIINN